MHGNTNNHEEGGLVRGGEDGRLGLSLEEDNTNNNDWSSEDVEAIFEEFFEASASSDEKDLSAEWDPIALEDEAAAAVAAVVREAREIMEPQEEAETQHRQLRLPAHPPPKAQEQERRRRLSLSLDAYDDPKTIKLKKTPYTRDSTNKSSWDNNNNNEKKVYKEERAKEEQAKEDQSSNASSSSEPPEFKSVEEQRLYELAHPEKTFTHVIQDKYTLKNALSIFNIFNHGVALFIYDPKEDDFKVMYQPGTTWEESRFNRIRRWMFNSLRVMFPERFTPDSPEFVVPIASMDYPQVEFYSNFCFSSRAEQSCVSKEFPPVLQFGSVFKLPKIPSTIPMPMPEKNHLGCFQKWAKEGVVCKQYQERDPENAPNGLVFGTSIGKTWDDLIPQVLWRATDRGFLTQMMPNLRRPDFELDIEPELRKLEKEQAGKSKDKRERRIASIKGMLEVYEELVPRWKGIVWSAGAELEAEDDGLDMPWCNIKYSTYEYMMGVDDKPYYDQLEGYGISSVEKPMNLLELADYKYHMDIGGGGGTTWSGTFQKMSMPGVLFHHLSPTKDYNHAMFQPWVHYIPLSEEMYDLKDKYEWAESHQEEARAISERATQRMRQLGTPEFFEEKFNEFFKDPLTDVINAYQPFESEDGMSWLEYIQKNNKNLKVMLKCKGHSDEEVCEKVNQDAFKSTIA